MCDGLITVSLVFHLQRQKGAVLAAHGIINKLIENIVSTNGLTATVAIIDAVLFASLTSSYHVTANLCLVKLYMNSLLGKSPSRLPSPTPLRCLRSTLTSASDPCPWLSTSLA